jgi:hypothetical protein
MRTLVVLALALPLLGCSGIRELDPPLRPDEVRDDERRAFECFAEQLPNLLRANYGSFHWMDGGVSDSWYAKPEHSRYYVHDLGTRVEFYAAGKAPPRGAGVVCADGCGSFVVSYPKDDKDCHAKPEKTGWHP